MTAPPWTFKNRYFRNVACFTAISTAVLSTDRTSGKPGCLYSVCVGNLLYAEKTSTWHAISLPPERIGGIGIYTTRNPSRLPEAVLVFRPRLVNLLPPLVMRLLQKEYSYGWWQ